MRSVVSQRPLAALMVLAVVLGISGCAGIDERADEVRRRNMVLVPQAAEPIARVRWSEVRGIEPLNERMVLFDGRQRPYLLVLARPCRGLDRNSIIVYGRRTSAFSPARDGFSAMDPLGMGIPRPCVPDSLYALVDEDVAWLEQALASR